MTTMNERSGQNQGISSKPTSPYDQRHLIDPRRSLWTIAAIVLVCVLSGILIGSYLTLKIRNEKDAENEVQELWIPDQNVDDCSGPTKLVTRTGWSAEKVLGSTDPLKLPSFRVIIAHTVTENCTSQIECSNAVRYIQAFHMNLRRFSDIGYNFLIGGDGAAYVGRGWDIQGAHTSSYNQYSICIAFMGTFVKLGPTNQQICAAKNLIASGVQQKKLTADYYLYGHRQLSRTESPGERLYKIIQTWDHWTDQVH